MTLDLDRRSLLIATGAGCLFPAAVFAGVDSVHRVVRRGGWLFVTARINNRKVEALLDSAAETTLADTVFAAHLKLGGGASAVARGTGAGTLDAQTVPHIKIEAGGVTVRDATIGVLDLTEVGQRLLGRRLDIVLGREIFDSGRLSVDIKGGTFGPFPDGRTPKGQKLDLQSDRGNELLPVSIEGKQGRATFDLGNGGDVLISRQFAAAHLLDGRPLGVNSGGGLGGGKTRQSLVLKSLTLAGRTFENIPANIDDSPEAADANVGVSILEHFTIVTDFPGRSIWLDAQPA